MYKPFITCERLQESLHPFHRQQHETMNVSVSKYAPKMKTYGINISFTNRVMIDIGIINNTAELCVYHTCLLNSTYRLLIDELFFYFDDLYENTKFVRDYIERNFECVLTYTPLIRI